jgi:Cdc6-like AAA superfamily ATPase
MKRRFAEIESGSTPVAEPDGASTPAPTDSSASGIPSVNPLNGLPFSKRYREIYEGRKKLPVWQFLDQLDKLTRENQVIVVEGETGSGKTTQVSSFKIGTRSRCDTYDSRFTFLCFCVSLCRSLNSL